MPGRRQQQFYPETAFGGYSDIDGTVVFYSRVTALLGPDDVILDVGCGRGRYGEDAAPIRRNLRIFKGRCARVIGIDMDPAAAENPFLDEFRSMVQEGPWPVADESVDMILNDCVLEHVDDPEFFFAECKRVLKPGGYLCIRTPNSWNYFAIVARCVPNRLHARVLGMARADRKEEDVFPTRYRCNTRRKILKMYHKYGFDQACVYGYDAEPGYLTFSWLTYFLGVLHQRFAPRMFKAAVFAFGRKNGCTAGASQELHESAPGSPSIGCSRGGTPSPTAEELVLKS